MENKNNVKLRLNDETGQVLLQLKLLSIWVSFFQNSNK